MMATWRHGDKGGKFRPSDSTRPGQQDQTGGLALLGVQRFDGKVTLPGQEASKYEEYILDGITCFPEKTSRVVVFPSAVQFYVNRESKVHTFGHDLGISWSEDGTSVSIHFYAFVDAQPSIDRDVEITATVLFFG